MKYYVKYRVTCECIEEVDANTPEEAVKIADDKIIAIKARVKAVCANTLELEIEGFSDEK